MLPATHQVRVQYPKRARTREGRGTLERAQDDADVIATILLARDQGLELAVRGGGHGVPGHGTVDDGVVLGRATTG